MHAYFEYALKVSVCLAIVFLFYSLLLKQTTHYTWNRYFLLLFSIFSFVVPFVNVNIYLREQQQNAVSFINEIPSIRVHSIVQGFNKSSGTFDYVQIITAIHLLVSFVLLVRLLAQLLSVVKIKSRATLTEDGLVKIYHLPDTILPFSFLNNIFINKDNYSENELCDIINHEQVHAEQNHTIDTLAIEIICIATWFNPFVWLIRKAVRENLEFIADNVVLQRGAVKKNYQYLLLKVTGHISSSITSNLKFTSLKSRIVMMNKTKTSSFHLFKFTLLVPVIVFLLLSFRTKKVIETKAVQTTASSIKTFTLSTLTYAIPNSRVKALVFKEKDKSLLKPGEVFDLALVSNEKDRLKSLLEKNGYDNLSSGSITFLIDSSAAGKSFSVQVNINVAASVVAIEIKGFAIADNEVLLPEKVFSKGEKLQLKSGSFTNYKPNAVSIYSYVNPFDNNKGC